MKRRTFLKQSLAATSLAGAAPLMQTVHAADQPAAAEYYELRTYTLKAAAQQKAVTEYLTQALGPALNRQGVTPVGVFTEMPALPADQIPLVHLVAVYSSVEQFGGVRAKLAADAAFKKAGASYLGVPATGPAYLRAESSLLAAISGMPKLEVPGKNTKVYNLRIYESHSETAGQKKIEMFNAGELAIFRRTGLKPVFFGETVIGSKMPNLTYMLAFDNDEARNAAWGRFREDPEWVKLKAIPEYADKNIVSKITNKLLAPVAGSQI